MLTTRDGPAAVDAKARFRSTIAIFAYPTCIRPQPLGEFPSKYCHNDWYGKKLEWCGNPTVKNLEDVSIRFDRIHERDRLTNDTARQHRPRLYLASCGKNVFKHKVTILFVLIKFKSVVTCHMQYSWVSSLLCAFVVSCETKKGRRGRNLGL